MLCAASLQILSPSNLYTYILVVALSLQVYLLSGFRNNTVLEYKSLKSFTNTSTSLANEVQLPFYWQGTGHVVYNGFLYCHKADTPNEILKVCL